MLWPLGASPADDDLRAPEGYRLRPAGPEDVPGFTALMAAVELGTWNDESLARTTASVVPGGWHVVAHEATGTLVATGMAQRNPIPLYPDGREVGWIAAHPDHGGRGLGRLVTAVATRRLLDLDAARIFLRTDDHRSPALKAYLRLGFVPHLWAEEMSERWQAICARLDWPFAPERWAEHAGNHPHPTDSH